MSTSHPLHQFADATSAQVRDLSSEDCRLIIRQKPEHAKVAIGKEKDRKPIDPPPIVQLQINRLRDGGQSFLQSPYFFMSVNLLKGGEPPPGSGSSTNVNTSLAGTLVSSLHRLKDLDNTDGGFFVFADLSVKVEGTYCLQFNLYEMRHATLAPEVPPLLNSNPLSQTLFSQQMEVCHLTSIISGEFKVHIAKNWPGMAESTPLTRSFSDQGVKLRLRKEPRTLLRKRGPASDDYEPMHYRSKIGRSDDSSGQGHTEGSGSLQPANSPIVASNSSELQQRTGSRLGTRTGEGLQNSYSSLRQANTPNLLERSEASNSSAPTKFEGSLSSQNSEMITSYHPRYSNSTQSQPSSQQESVSSHAMSAVSRAEDFGGNMSRRGSSIAQLRKASTHSSISSPSQSMSGIPFAGGSGNQYLSNTNTPASNRTSMSDFGGAYTHQPPHARQETPQSQAYSANYPQHNYSRSQTSLTSHSPATSRSTPQSYYSFSAGPRDAHTGMHGSALTSPFESPDVDRRGAYGVWSDDGSEERSSLSNRRNDPANPPAVLYSTPSPFYNQRHNTIPGINRQQNRTNSTISPTQVHGLGLVGPYSTSSTYMPPPNLMQSASSGFLPSLPGGMGSSDGGIQQERSSSAPDGSNLSSTSGAGGGF